MRNCSSRSTISSCTSWVWLTTMLRLVSKGAMEPGPPTESQVVGLMVEVISSMRPSKSAWAPPPSPPGPTPDGVAAIAADAGDGCRAVWPPSGTMAGIGGRPAAAALHCVGNHRQRRRRHADRVDARPAVSAWVVQAPGMPMLGLAMKFGMGITRSATLYSSVYSSAVAHLLAGDLQHFVLDHVVQVQRLQDQIQALFSVTWSRRSMVTGVSDENAFLLQALRIQVHVHVRHPGQVVHDLAQPGIFEGDGNRRRQLLFDLHFPREAVTLPLHRQLAAAGARQLLPLLLVREDVGTLSSKGMEASSELSNASTKPSSFRC